MASITANNNSSFTGSTVTVNVNSSDSETLTISGLNAGQFVLFVLSNCTLTSSTYGYANSSGVISKTVTFNNTGAYSVEAKGYASNFLSVTHFAKLQGTVSANVSGTISINGGTNVSQGEQRTLTISVNTAGTYAYNSVGNSSSPRFTPRSGTVTATAQNLNPTVTITAQPPLNNSGTLAIASFTTNYFVMPGSGVGNVNNKLDETSNFTIFRTPTAPTTITFSNTTTTATTVTASGGAFGIVQVSNNGTTWQSNGHTFTGLTAGSTNTFYARRLNTVAASGTITDTVTTQQNAPVAPSISPTAVFTGAGNILLSANPGNNGNGNEEFLFSGTHTIGWQSSSQTTLGAAAQAGNTWSVQSRATVGSSTVTGTSQSITLPSASISAPSSINEGQSGNVTFSFSNVPSSSHTYYYDLLPAGQFSVASGSFSSSGGSVTRTIEPLADNTTEGPVTGTVKLYAHSGKSVVLASTTFTINDTSTGVTITAPDVATSGHTIAGTFNVNTSVAVNLASTGSGGTLAYNIGSSSSYPSTGWQSSSSFNVVRNNSYFYFARQSNTQWDVEGPFTIPYVTTVDTAINLTSSTTLQLTASSHTLNFTNAARGQYRILRQQAGWTGGPFVGGQYHQWLATVNVGSTASAATTFSTTLSQTSGANRGLPLQTSGASDTYRVQVRIPSHLGGQPNTTFQDVTVDGSSTFTLTRAQSFTATGPTSVSEGGTLTFTVNYPTNAGIPNNTTVPYTITGIGEGNITSGSLSGNITLSGGSGSTSVVIRQDNIEQSNVTALFSLGATTNTGNFSTGSPQASTTVILTEGSSSGTGTPTSGGSGDFGLEIRGGSNNNILIDSDSRVTNMLSSDTYNAATEGASKVLFSAFDCRSASEIGFLTAWSGTFYIQPTVTRNSNGQGVTVARNTQTGGNSGTLTVTLIRY